MVRYPECGRLDCSTLVAVPDGVTHAYCSLHAPTGSAASPRDVLIPHVYTVEGTGGMLLCRACGKPWARLGVPGELGCRGR